MKGSFLALLLFLSLLSFVWTKEVGFTQADRERLIRLEAILKTYMEQTNRRFEDMNKRFEDINKRIEELREDMNIRFDQLYTFLWIITGIFTTLTSVVIGFAYWDRRTIVRKARDEAVEKVDRLYDVGKLNELLKALRKLAKEDEKLARVLKNFGLM